MSANSMPLTVALDARLIGGTSTGDSTYWAGLVDGLAKLDSNVQYLLYSNASRPASVPEHPRFRWIELSGSGRWWSLVRFPLAARRAGAHVCHVQYNLSPLARGGVTTIHDVSFFIEPAWFPARDRLLLQRFVPASAARAKAVITVSETSRAEIHRYIPAAKGKTTAIYNAAALPRERLEHGKAAARVREAFGVDGPFLLTVGTRWPRKNMNLAIEAVGRLDEGVPLLITGKAGWGEETPHPRVRHTGYVDEAQLNALFSAAQMYLAPSLHEGFGIPVLEAFRCGAPVVSSTGGALPEVVGDAGLVVPGWDPAHWAQSIAELRADSGKLNAMREAGFEREKQFSWTKSATQHEAVYTEVGRS